jgi:hypothetical protein
MSVGIKAAKASGHKFQQQLMRLGNAPARF